MPRTLLTLSELNRRCGIGIGIPGKLGANADCLERSREVYTAWS